MLNDARWGTQVACADFYEWNARSQLTTWNPTPPGAAKKPDGPDDYASKHWSGLINVRTTPQCLRKGARLRTA